MRNLNNIFINSTLAFVSAFIITTIIHESGHFLSYYSSGAQAILYHNSVYTPDQQLDVLTRIISALAGPVISCIQGIIFAVIVLRKPDNSARYLLFLWMSLLGFINFFGYLMLTPISIQGDTGKVAELLNLSYPLRIFIAVFGMVIIVIIVLKMGKLFSNFIPNETEMSIRRRYINSLILYPILAGSIINVILAFPIPVILSVIYPATSSFVVLSAYGIILKTKSKFSPEAEIEKKISVFLICITVTGIVLNRILTLGIG